MIGGKLNASCGDERYSTPALVVDGIEISDMTGNQHSKVWSGIIDTGADRMVVPLSVCEDLHLSPREMRRPKGFDHQASAQPIPLYYVQIRVPGIGDFSLLTYGVRRSSLLLGRDFLSSLVLLVDNPTSYWQLGHHTAWSRLVRHLIRLK